MLCGPLTRQPQTLHSQWAGQALCRAAAVGGACVAADGDDGDEL